MFCRTIIGLLIVVSLQAGEFQSGQAARAVIGQSNFSVRETGVSATALALQGNHLYAAEGSGKILTFDIAKLPGPREDMAGYPKGSCNVCGLAALAVANQNVFPGIAGVSSLGRTVVAADPAHHHVLIWRDSSEPNAEPDVILGRPDSSSISASTLVNPVSVAFDGRHVFVGDAALHRVLVWDTLPTSNDQPADAVLGQPSFSSTDTSDNPDAGTIFLPSALASDGTNLFVADAAAHRILVFTAGDSALPEDAVVNSATLSGGPIAPGTLVTIRAAALNTRSESVKQTADERLPVKLGAVEVVMNGVALPLLSVSPQEIQAQIPYGLENVSSASLYVRIEHSDSSATITNAIAVSVSPAAPGVFAFTGTEPRPGLVLHRSGAAEESAGTPVTAQSPASAGEIVTVWATGLGAVVESDASAMEGVPFAGPPTPVASPVGATVNGHAAQVLSAVLPEGAIGVYEVRILLPPDVGSAARAQLFLSEHGVTSNTIVFPIQASKL